MSSTPVTTNPLLIMLINMTIVFAVLYLLGWVIRFIHAIDPTKAKQEEIISDIGYKEAEVSTAAAAMPLAEKELAAVVTTAIMAAGYQNVRVKSIKKL